MKNRIAKICITILLGGLMLVFNAANLYAENPRTFSQASYSFQGAQYMLSDFDALYTCGLDEFTISLWYKYEGAVLGEGQSRVLFANAEEYPYATRIDIQRIGDEIYLNGTAKLADGSFLGSNGRRIDPDGQWHHVAFVVWETNNDVNTRLYWDGQWDHVTGQKPGSSLPEPWPVRWMVGAQVDCNGAPENYFNGKIDEISFWSTALDAGEVQLIYNSGVPNDLSVIPVTPHWMSLWLHDDFFDHITPWHTFTNAGVTLSDDIPGVADTMPPTPPKDLKATSVGQRQIAVQWLASKDNVAVMGYYLTIRPEESSDGWVDEYDLDANALYEEEYITFTFSDLDPGAIYLITVAAYDESGNKSETASLRVASPFLE